ncbi:MAG: ABC transporter substrate-binding protein [Actinomycetia bacterium]|nr:ABC transporter substrate-binding protein [Actinomycetes bacterium]
MKRLRNVVMLLLAFALLAAACSSSDDGGEATDTTATTAAPTTTAATETTTPPDTGGDTTTTAGEVDLTGRSVTVFGPESSDEEAGAIQDALNVLAADTGLRIIYTGARDFSDQINAQAAGGNPPDIAIFPQPGKLADFARQEFILPLPDDVTATVNDQWPEAFVAFGNVDGAQYGVPNKADIKSLVWYDKPSFDAAGYTVPTTLDELWALTAQIRDDGGTPWCIGIESGPATGWTFTDWVEDIMLRVEGPDFYDQWVSNEIKFSDDRVKAIWNTILDEWNIPGNVFAAGGSIAATPFGDNGQPLVDGDCVLHRQASFYSAFLPEGTVTGPEGIDVFFFPGDTADNKPVLGGGTLAASFKDAPEVWVVMDFFATAEYAEIRQAAQTERKDGSLSGFLSANTQQDLSVYQPIEQSFITLLTEASVLRFDGSDLMPAAVGAGSFWTEGTSAVNGDKSVDDATAAIDASWP